MTRKKKRTRPNKSNTDKVKEIMSAFGPPQPSGCADPRTLGGQIVGPGGPHDRGAVLIDSTDCVLLESMEVCVIDRILDGESQGDSIFMTLQGRVNKSTRQVQVGYIFDADGAAAIITELLALADRCGPSMLTAVVDRLVDLDRNGTSNIAWLRCALDCAQGQV